jgi:hypothetical protein
MRSSAFLAGNSWGDWETKDEFIKDLQNKTTKWKSGNISDLKVATFRSNTAVSHCTFTYRRRFQRHASRAYGYPPLPEKNEGLRFGPLTLLGCEFPPQRAQRSLPTHAKLSHDFLRLVLAPKGVGYAGKPIDCESLHRKQNHGDLDDNKLLGLRNDSKRNDESRRSRGWMTYPQKCHERASSRKRERRGH